jgi:hypothetical protein
MVTLVMCVTICLKEREGCYESSKDLMSSIEVGMLGGTIGGCTLPETTRTASLHDVEIRETLSQDNILVQPGDRQCVDHLYLLCRNGQRINGCTPRKLVHDKHGDMPPKRLPA